MGARRRMDARWRPLARRAALALRPRSQRPRTRVGLTTHEESEQVTLRTEELVARGLVAPERLEDLRRVADEFAVAVNDDMAALIDPTDPVDPIAAQFVPNTAELDTVADDQRDPIGDERWSPLPGLVHRYPDRVLLK